MAREYIPAVGTDVLIHQKDTDRTERVVFPYTRYRNVLSAPNVVTTDIEIGEGAPFHLLKTGKITLTEKQILNMCGDLI